MAKSYMPELGQMAFGQPTQAYPVPDYVEALFFGLWHELERVYWNKYQKRMDNGGHNIPAFIPGLTVRPYNWNDEQDERPNFEYGDVKICWYKYPGRGMSTNVDLSPEQWVAWFRVCLNAIQVERG